MAYMASMIILFLNFFIRRYVFQRSSATMSGVIKSIGTTTSNGNGVHRGVAVTDALGIAVVMIPLPLLPNSTFRYQLTAIGGAMPQLHVEKEIVLKSSQYGVFIIAGATEFGKVSWQVEVLYNNI